MKHSITLTIPFCFKGKSFSPSVTLDLEQVCQQEVGRERLCHLVAMQNKIGHFSYEYEVLQSSELHFSEATGLAKEYLSEDTFDLEGFKQTLNEVQALTILQKIAHKTLDINDLNNEKHEMLKQALLHAYYEGQATR